MNISRIVINLSWINVKIASEILLCDILVKHGVYISRDRKIGNSFKLLNRLDEEYIQDRIEQEILYQMKKENIFL